MRKIFLIIFVAVLTTGATTVKAKSNLALKRENKEVMLLRSDDIEIPTCISQFEALMDFCGFLLDYALVNCDAAFSGSPSELKECETITIDMFGALTTANVNALMRCHGIYD